MFWSLLTDLAEVDSEEEVMALTMPDSEEEDSDNEIQAYLPDSDDDKSVAQDQNDMEEGWGTTKSAYYGADEAENEDDAVAEEAEARRIQKKHMDMMSSADFFDEDLWATSLAPINPTAAAKVIEILPKTIDETISPEQRLKVLYTYHPEFQTLRKEFIGLQETHQMLALSAKAAEAMGGNIKTSAVIRKWTVLSAYLGVLAMYFAILTGEPVRESGGIAIKEHPVMEGVFQCRQMWERVRKSEIEEGLKMPVVGKSGEKKRKRIVAAEESRSESEEEEEEQEKLTPPKKAKKAKKGQPTRDFSDLDALTASLRSRKPRKIKRPAEATTSCTTQTADGLDVTDFGEDRILNDIDAEEKSAHRHGLRFYASQIVSKSTKRAAAGRNRGGDDDVPHKERRKEQELRLQREAAKRRATAGADLDNEDPTESDRQAVGKVNVSDSETEYYRLLAESSKKRKVQKEELYQTLKAAEKEGNMVQATEGELGPDGKRAIGWKIQKNKGLTPYRKKDVRNPRVKKKKAYEKAKKKLGSTKQIYKGGPRGNYGGETAGIKTNIVKSVKFAL